MGGGKRIPATRPCWRSRQRMAAAQPGPAAAFHRACVWSGQRHCQAARGWLRGYGTAGKPGSGALGTAAARSAPRRGEGRWCAKGGKLRQGAAHTLGSGHLREMKTQAPVGLLAMCAGLAERTRAHAQCSLQAGNYAVQVWERETSGRRFRKITAAVVSILRNNL